MADVDDALRNVDNVYTMRDGRVLCCEDGWRGGNRSYPNDGLYVYEPPEAGGSGGETATETSPDESTGDGTPTADSEGTTDGDAPGLGVATGLAGVAGAGYLLQRGSGDDRD